MNNIINKKTLRAAILSVSMLQLVSLGLSPVLADIQRAFPKESAETIQTIATFPALVTIVVTIITGRLATVISKRVLANLGVLLLSVAGLLGFLFNSGVPLLYLWAVIIGCGMGLYIPCITIMIPEYFEVCEQGSLLGQQSTFTNGGGLIMMLVGGLLATVGWNFNYLIYTILGVPVFFIGLAGFPREQRIVGQRREKAKLGLFPFYYGIVAMLYAITYTIVPTNAAMLIEEAQLAGANTVAAIAGYASAAMMLGGVIAGLIYGRLSLKLRDYMLSLAYGICATGLLIDFFAQNILLIILGSFIAGLGISFLVPQMIFSVSHSVNPAVSTLGISIALALSNFGSFASAQIITPLSRIISGVSDVRPRFLLGACLGIIMMILLAITTTLINKKRLI